MARTPLAAFFNIPNGEIFSCLWQAQVPIK
jgi:hypothetical protein